MTRLQIPFAAIAARGGRPHLAVGPPSGARRHGIETMAPYALTKRRSVRATAVLLAAGLSRRMGGGNKLLIDIGGQPLARRTALACLAAGVRLHVVLGHEAGRVREALAGLPAVFVENPRYAEGRASSVRAGLDSLDDFGDAVLVVLADQPALTAEDIGGLLDAFARSDRRHALVPYYRGARGNPVVFPADVIAGIVASGPDASCRDFLDRNPDRVRRYEAPNDHFISDIDAPDDLRAFAERESFQPERWIEPAENVLPQWLEWRRQGLRAALVTLVGVEGSSPRAIGAQMAVAETGDAVGHISGGCLEGALVVEALAVMRSGENRTVRYGKDSPYIDIVLPCGSGLDVHFDQNAPVAAVERALGKLEARRPAALTFGPACERVYQPRLRLVVAGAGPAVTALARMAQLADMEVEILTPEPGLRAEAARRGLNARELLARRPPEGLKLDPWTAAVTMFHDHGWEAAVLPLFLASECFYLGAVGSRKTHEARKETLLGLGVAPEALARLRAPAGLIQNARRPVELAVSMLAEVMAAAKGSGRS
jgi:xanthine dehydrogenase accessory factor